MPKESGKVRYAYGVAMSLLLGGSAFSLATGQAGAQVAQNSPMAMAPQGAPMSFADLTARLQPSVVNISTKQRVPVRGQSADPFEEFFRRFDPNGQGQGQSQGQGQGRGQGQQQQAPGGGGGGARTRETGSLGSGFIISPDGYIVTNNHLIQGSGGNGTVDSVTVITVDRKEYPARIVGRDETSDLALLKIDGTNLPYVNWGDSTKSRVGDWVLAIGNPYGLGGTVTAGIISALHRGITGIGPYDRYIQTDASINMGNSGGPMFDLYGSVIGINSALISPTGASVGIGLAIPAELAKPVIDSLRKGQRPQRGYLGVGLQPLDESIAPSLGLPKDMGEIVRSVVPGGPAAKGGLQQGDVILRVNGRDVTPEETVSYLVANTQVGSRAAFDIVRGGRRQTLNIVVGQRPTEEELAKLGGAGGNPGTSDDASAAPKTTLGLGLSPLTPEIARATSLPPTAHGVMVTVVDPNSDAAEKGLQRGDLIVSINQQLVTSPAQIVTAVDAARRANRSSVLLLVKRGTAPEAFIGIDISQR
ncbi:MAG: Do family serine endopeptidase [Sphingomicrobium sp.]